MHPDFIEPGVLENFMKPASFAIQMDLWFFWLHSKTRTFLHPGNVHVWPVYVSIHVDVPYSLFEQ